MAGAPPDIRGQSANEHDPRRAPDTRATLRALVALYGSSGDVKEGHNQRAEPCPACSPDRVPPDPPFCDPASDDGGMEDLANGRRMTKRPATCAGGRELRRAEAAETVPISRRVAQLSLLPLRTRCLLPSEWAQEPDSGAARSSAGRARPLDSFAFTSSLVDEAARGPHPVI